MERAVLRLAARAAVEGMDHRLLLFDKPFRSERVDLSPGTLVTAHIPRRPGLDLQFANKLAGKLIEWQTEVVHAHNDTALFYAALAKIFGRLSGTALIGTFRNRPTHATVGARLSTRWAAGRATEIVAVSQELNNWLVRSGWVDRCRTICNGIDLADFSPIGPVGISRGNFGIPQDAILVGHVGRFAPIKRHIDLLDAAARLDRVRPPIYFLLAGSGPLFERVRERAARYPNVIMFSNITDVGAFLRALDIFVLCSEHEGTPQALLEAMACARPIVATRVGGIPDLLDADGPAPAGRLIPPWRPDRLAAEILRLAEDGQLRSRLAGLARQRIRAFSFDREWAQYVALYTAAARRCAEPRRV